MTSTTEHKATPIEQRDTPLVFPVEHPQHPLVAPATAGRAGIRVAARALPGMQKEALCAYGPSGTVWRMVCDEGPYLNGTDLAPPPLAFFSAGMAAYTASALRREAARQECELTDLHIIQDNKYTMEGSALRGTMIAGALPVGLTIDAEVSDGRAGLPDLVRDALVLSPVDALMRDKLVDTFSITLNGEQIPTGKVVDSPAPVPEPPAALFDESDQPQADMFPEPLIAKLSSTDSVFEANHGAGAALKDQQKRELHIRSDLHLRSDGLKQIRVQIFKPIGSVFQFLADDPPQAGSSGRAPTGLTYLSAGLAFCFMTQIGRYADIAKKQVDSYSVIQDTLFDPVAGKTLPVDTHTYLETPESADTARHIVDMAEQTCFLHGACRTSNKTRIRIKDL
ncbi:OsmC family protein [Exilibacterium tricleocarpae]|uniref:OsmC family protein n=1 Tax=Exilibacterium tricleocarpae TaxID=2591008 RepID=A0A545T664_9GAMM|nr:OsmC family protein [Exilibacterium tricleocarpae]TQV72720.1 OsmC family protein [Exilibacterium tricleocarpae]